MARARDVCRIIDILKLIGLHGTKRGDAWMVKLCDQLDKQRGFTREKDGLK